jgi:hypothetical protein
LGRKRRDLRIGAGRRCGPNRRWPRARDRHNQGCEQAGDKPVRLMRFTHQEPLLARRCPRVTPGSPRPPWFRRLLIGSAGYRPAARVRACQLPCQVHKK